MPYVAKTTYAPGNKSAPRSVMVQSESVLKGHGFSRAVSIVFSLRL